MGGKKSKGKAPTSSIDAGATTTASSGVIHQRQCIAENFSLIWVDASIDESKHDYQNTLEQLRSVVNDVNIFTQSNQCVQFLNRIEDEKVFVIISGSLGQHLIPDIHSLPQVDAIYIFCSNKSRHDQWIKEWVKIKGIYTDIESICHSLQLVTKQCDEDFIAVSFVTGSDKTSGQSLNQLEPLFMYTQLFKEILLEMKHDEQSIKHLVDYCREFYKGNTNELTIINTFEYNYQTESSIWWYTRDCFIYHMLNRALRTLEADTIINMGFFIRDLHQEIQKLYQNQIGTYHGKSFFVYRGQVLSNIDFEKLQKTKGGLISFNNFLSTSKKREVALDFARRALTKTDMVGILFKMSIDPSISSAPFASIENISYHKTEKEILFSMHTVFRIGEIKKIDNKNLLYKVNLEFTTDDDEQLRTLFERIRKEVVGETGWKRLGQLLIKLSEFDKAEALYNILLEQISNERDKGHYYNQLRYIKDGQGDYTKAISYYEKAFDIYQKTLTPNHPSLATFYGNIAGIHYNMGEYSKALSFYEKALEIRQKVLSPNHSDLATTYNNIGLVYYNMEEYSKALSFYKKALVIKEKTLPSNHPSLAISYNNIAGVYNNMREYLKALSFYEKALEIEEKTLPPNHPDSATSYNNIGLIHKNMGEYSKALSFYEKALEIYQKSLPSNHSLLATSYNNIGLVYMNLEKHPQALSYLDRALNIFQSSLPPNHPSIQNVQQSIKSLKKKL